MKSIRRKLLNALTVLSLVLFVLVVMAWASSPFINATYLKMVGPNTARLIYVTRGSLRYFASYPFPRPVHGPIDGFTFDMRSNVDTFSWDLVLGNGSGELPLLFFAFPFAILPLARVSLWVWKLHYSDVRRERQLRGQCSQCGYDIRATPQRCPECGSTPRALSPASGLPNRRQILYYLAILGFSALAIRASLALRFIDFGELRSHPFAYLNGRGKLNITERTYPGMLICIVSIWIAVMFVRKLRRSYRDRRSFTPDAAASTR